ncbi:MAG: PEP-CTERM system TPR-repeat protein PrsT [Gammaproteobacteria bacterium]
MSSSRKSRRRSRRRRRRIAIALVLLALIGGTLLLLRPGVLDVEESMQRAQAAYEAGELNAAIIDLKNVLANEPAHREARFLLGRIYVDAGNAQGAIKELRRARELGVSDQALALALTNALLMAGDFDDAATEIALHGDAAEIDWLVLRGMLDLAQQRLDDARATFTSILEQAPDNERARRGLIQAELAAGNPALARREVEALLDTGEADSGLWVIKGELDLHDGMAEAALGAFDQAVALGGSEPIALMGKARALLALERPQEAGDALDAIGGAGEDDPRVQFLRAKVAAARGDEETALGALRKVLQLVPMHRDSLVLAARMHFARAEYSHAQDYVSRLLELAPQDPAAQRMLGAIQLAAGRMDGLDEMRNALGDADVAQDPGMLALLGTAYLKHGRIAAGEESLARAAELAPDSLPIRTQLAMSRLGGGNTAQAIAELESIVSEAPDFAQAHIVLVLAHLAARDGAAALRAAATLRETHPDSAVAANVLGYAREAGDDAEGARAAYEEAVALDADFHPARINLARLAIAAGDDAAGRRRFEEVLERSPAHPFALLGMAALALKADDLDEAERLWTQAREQNADAVAPRLLLAKHYRAKGNLPLAESAIGEAYALAPYAAQVQAEYATIKLQAGQPAAALEAASALVERAPGSVPALELLARVYNQMGDEPALTATLERMAEVAPDAVGARVLLARLALRRDDLAAAGHIADELVASAEESAVAAGHELQGDLARARGDNAAARTAYSAAFAAAPSSSTVIKLDRVERALGEAGDRLERWLTEHPDDLQVRFARASILQRDGTGASAIPEYERMLAARGENPVLLNNLAWLYHEAGDERALATARKAHELAPAQPEILDTYGWILVANGQHEQGLDLLGKAADAAPGNPDIRFHLLSARHTAGVASDSRAALERLLAEHENFPTRAQAEALLASLIAE